MTVYRLIVFGFFLTSACAVVNKETKRREIIPHNTYGPPNRQNAAFSTQSLLNGFGHLPKYSPAPQNNLPIPHQEYGRPNIPHRQYGVPVLKYGPPKVNVEYELPQKNSFHDEIKSHFGLPKPIYGVPQALPQQNTFIIQPNYGAPQQNYGAPQQNYGAPQQNYGPPQQNYGAPQQNYGPPPQEYNPPSTNYGVPLKSKYGVPAPPYPKYGPPTAVNHNTASSNGSPQLLTPPPLQYGSPQSTAYDQHSSSTSYGDREATYSYHNGVTALPEKQIQIIETNVDSSLQVPTISCDGWRPIPGPTGGHLISQTKEEHTPFILSDDQLIAVALQAGFGDNVQQLPSTIAIKDYNSYGDGHNTDILQSESIKVNNNNLQDIYGSPPADSYAPGSNSYAPSSYHPLKYSGSEQNFNIGLVPPNEVYGVPHKGLDYSLASAHGGSHHSNNNLGIQYGTISGNLKHWLSNGTSPKKPIAFRPPVPQGLLESIGASVQHLDQYGVKPPIEANTYIPPTPTETPQYHHHHEEDHHLSSYASENVQYAQSLPSIQEPRYHHTQDCGIGPSLNSGASSHHHHQEINDYKSNQISSYAHAEASLENNVVNDFEGNTVNSDFNYPASFSDSYIPPPSGDPLDYESNQATASASQKSFSGENSPSELPGLHNINVISAKKSHSVTIPVQGQLGTYQLQFQSANPIDGSSKDPTQQGQDHEQILSQGLLQTILSAIEQPQLEKNYEKSHNEDHHKEVDEFFNSPEGKQALSD